MARAAARDQDPSSIGIMEGAFFVSRKDLLEWANTQFQLNLTKVEECASGAVYIQIIDAAHPGNINMSKVRWNAKQEYEYTQNYKLLQSAFTKIGIKKHIEVEKLIRAKAQDNLEFLQWMKAYYDRMSEHKPYDPIEKRKLAAASGMPEWASLELRGTNTHLKRNETGNSGRVLSSPNPSMPHPSSSLPNGNKPLDTCSSVAASCVNVSPITLHKQVVDLHSQLQKKDAIISELQVALDQEKTGRESAEHEKEFYFSKLRAIEIKCQEEKVDSMTSEELTRILYAADDAEGDEGGADGGKADAA